MVLLIFFLGGAGNSSIEPLSWDLRLKIVIGAARGLAFLHSSEKIIYRDFKASNILIDGVRFYMVMSPYIMQSCTSDNCRLISADVEL